MSTTLVKPSWIFVVASTRPKPLVGPCLKDWEHAWSIGQKICFQTFCFTSSLIQRQTSNHVYQVTNRPLSNRLWPAKKHLLIDWKPSSMLTNHQTRSHRRSNMFDKCCWQIMIVKHVLSSVILCNVEKLGCCFKLNSHTQKHSLN